MSKGLTYAAACADPNLFGPWFEGESWRAWRVLDRTIFGLPLVEQEEKIFHEICGNRRPPEAPAQEVWLALGRRAAKSLKAASMATYQATIGSELYGYRDHLKPGERGVVQVLGVDREQARVVFRYVNGFFDNIPMLKSLVKKVTSDTIELTNGLAIEITTADKRRVRGRTVICAILDEASHWRSEETSNPDDEIYAALKPATATIPNAMIIGISSPYARRGLFFRKVNDNWAKDGNVLSVRAPTWVMNPTLPKDGEFIAGEFQKDPAWARAEYGAEWRDDIETFVSLDAVQACIEVGVRERKTARRNRYVAFVDMAGGSGGDSATLALAHREGDTAVLDCVREIKPPFSPESVIEEYADLVKSYRCTKVYGDRFGGEFPREIFRRHGMNFDVADKSKSQIYQAALPLINSGAVDLLDNDLLVNQLVSLERRKTRGGRESIDHPPGGKDDLANAVCGALVTSMTKHHRKESWMIREPIVQGIGTGHFDPLR